MYINNLSEDPCGVDFYVLGVGLDVGTYGNVSVTNCQVLKVGIEDLDRFPVFFIDLLSDVQQFQISDFFMRHSKFS